QRASASACLDDHLEGDLDRQLHVEWLARADARRAVEVANRIRDRAVAVDRARSGSKIDAVKQVKHLGAELHFHPLANRDVLEHRQVNVSISRGMELIA